ncbi:hypothetical protein FJQ98_15635 [Lysinibacillus agricola]|uniref:Uncharacterized protein n=1 Tax=Lysinibacillus agricola TaxID=2590012 RepID=A0ABX7ALB8_9BACI|nr:MULTISPECIES: hypothetical protein [Lysinibacillus]QQP10681.1 hypothetical protein FJQ98_15635 [Lysinibacillus agricola]
MKKCTSLFYEVKMGEAVECENIEHPRFNVKKEMNKFKELMGELLACGTC